MFVKDWNSGKKESFHGRDNDKAKNAFQECRKKDKKAKWIV